MTLRNDIQLDVATANSRRAKSWKNTKMPWSDIVDRMSRTVRTSETVAEFKKMGKNQQSEIKDCGGFVGGYCNNGNRSDVRHRSLIALDADFAGPDLWDDWCLLYGRAAAIYSTHKHTPEKPRLRLVVPLARAVSPDEFQAIGRKVAETLGIDQFDDSTYQPQRLMFWPSTSSDGEYVFQYEDAPILDPDEVLKTYVDWKDVSSWPMSSRVSEVIKKSAEKQQDPTEKEGLIGAFCRTYSIEEAIEAFIPAYEPCQEEGRYTYTEGSTAGGVRVYDGKFSYSFHATDPASGQLCNAWDLVRIHRFGKLDADDTEAPVTKRPSWSAMTDLAREDLNVKRQILAERSSDFDEEIPDDVEDDSWKRFLTFDKAGAVVSTIENAVVILEHDQQLKGALQYNEMSHTVETTKPLPWREDKGAWTDSDDSALRYYLEKRYKLSGKDKIFDAANVVAMQHAVHPVRDYLDSCTWDGVPRVDTLLIDYLGAEDSEYTRAVTKKVLAAAVARIYRPGVKFDYMLVIKGKQGTGKSSLIARLGGDWFSDSLVTLQGKEAFEQLSGVWIMEVGELAGMKKAEAETIKLFISKQSDRFRPAFGRRTQEFPRQCIFIGSTNESFFLRDMTGNRRFWPVDTPNEPTRSVWSDLTPEMVRLIWGEACEIFQSGEKLYLPPNIEKVAMEIQSEYEEENPRAGVVQDYLSRLLPEDWEMMSLYDRRQWLEEPANGGTEPRTTVSTMEIWAEALGGNPDKMDRYSARELNDIMAVMPGWRRCGAKKTSTLYGRQRYYRRIEDE